MEEVCAPAAEQVEKESNGEDLKGASPTGSMSKETSPSKEASLSGFMSKITNQNNDAVLCILEDERFLLDHDF